ncbi:hypothetical protein BST25_16105 [Mycobacterium heidelbergense]|uniref:Uncharacterized protein n=2 Tax=Mycobacterium heidelbergense TaxID=53376 RepID=A0A1X0DIN2_MYCHE|nr:hypothetical protein BST25_16105 [Mycobacterium heidelbergense]
MSAAITANALAFDAAKWKVALRLARQGVAGSLALRSTIVAVPEGRNVVQARDPMSALISSYEEENADGNHGNGI